MQAMRGGLVRPLTSKWCVYGFWPAYEIAKTHPDQVWFMGAPALALPINSNEIYLKIANPMMNEHIAGDKSGDKPNT